MSRKSPVDQILEFWAHTCPPPEEVETEYEAISSLVYAVGDRVPDVEPNPEYALRGEPTIRATIISNMVRIHSSLGDSVRYPWKMWIESPRPDGWGWVTVSDEGGWKFWPRQTREEED